MQHLTDETALNGCVENERVMGYTMRSLLKLEIMIYFVRGGADKRHQQDEGNSDIDSLLRTSIRDNKGR
jgi:hypothetical protein